MVFWSILGIIRILRTIPTRVKIRDIVHITSPSSVIFVEIVTPKQRQMIETKDLIIVDVIMKTLMNV